MEPRYDREGNTISICTPSLLIRNGSEEKNGGAVNSPSSWPSPSVSTALSILRSDGGSARCRSSDSRGRWNRGRSRWDGSGWGAVGVIQAGPGDGVSRSVG
jgi:hypothetical protein